MLLRQWEWPRSAVLSAGERRGDEIQFSLKKPQEEVHTAVGSSMREDMVERNLGCFIWDRLSLYFFEFWDAVIRLYLRMFSGSAVVCLVCFQASAVGISTSESPASRAVSRKSKCLVFL